MRKRSNIIKLTAFFLCALYLPSAMGMTAYACACTNSMQLSLIAKQAEHSCMKEQKQPCCVKKQVQESKQGFQLNKKPCCTTQVIALKNEHQPEQVRLNVLLTDFSQPILFSDTLEIAFNANSNDITGSLSRYAIPPKIPLIYQHSCLRL